MDSSFLGLNHSDLDKLRKELIVRANEVAAVLKSFNTVMQNAPASLSDDIGSLYMRKYEQLSANYKIINENLLSITDEFSRLKVKYINKDEQIAAQIKANTR